MSAFWDELPVIRDSVWQMAYGERMALEGLLTQVRPALAVEIGTAEGGSLRRIAAHAREVHALDIDPAMAEVVATIPNATAHIGDSADVLPDLLAELHRAGRNVDFVLVDGSHSAEGVQQDMRALLESPACARTVVVVHDSANEGVRDGLEALDLPSHPKVVLSMLDFVPGYLVVPDHVRSREIWNGLGVVVLDADASDALAREDSEHENVSHVYRVFRDVATGVNRTG